VAVFVANLPSVWPLMREHIRFLRDHTDLYTTGQSRMPRYGYGSEYGNLSKNTRSHVRTSVINVESDEMELNNSYNGSDVRSLHSPPWLHSGDLRVASENSSLEGDERATNDLSSWKGTNNIKVQVNTKVEIQRDNWDGTKLSGLQTTTQIEGPEQNSSKK
jgi:hypothetical protein